jgi:hypothetical protein
MAETEKSLEELTKGDLVKMAKNLGISSNGKKSEIIDRILEVQAAGPQASDALPAEPLDDLIPDDGLTRQGPDRIEEYEVEGPDGPVQIRHNIDNGETEIIG